MGCGCKNKANNQTSATPQTAGSQKQTNQTTYVQESVKDAIKKTVEKYYKKNS